MYQARDTYAHAWRVKLRGYSPQTRLQYHSDYHSDTHMYIYIQTRICMCTSHMYKKIQTRISLGVREEMMKHIQCTYTHLSLLIP